MNEKNKYVNFVYMLPLLTGLFLFRFWPLIQILIASFKEGYVYSSNDYYKLGFGNYIKIVNDKYFIQAIVNTVIYMLLVTFFTVILSFLISWSLFRIRKFVGSFIVLILVPLITSDVVIGICWRYMFNDKGIINALLEQVGMSGIPWLTDTNYSFVSLVIFGIWTSLSMTALLFYSAMQRINPNILVAAQLDQSSDGKILRSIVLPMLKTTIKVVTVINMISAALVFNGLFSLYSGLPGPYYNIYTAVYYIYAKAGEGAREFGVACAASVYLLVLVVIFLIIRCVHYEEKK